MTRFNQTRLILAIAALLAVWTGMLMLVLPFPAGGLCAAVYVWAWAGILRDLWHKRVR